MHTDLSGSPYLGDEADDPARDALAQRKRVSQNVDMSQNLVRLYGGGEPNGAVSADLKRYTTPHDHWNTFTNAENFYSGLKEYQYPLRT